MADPAPEAEIEALRLKYKTHDAALREILRLRGVNARNKSRFEALRAALKEARTARTGPGSRSQAGDAFGRKIDDIMNSIFGKRSL